ncbi:hypothetical protein HJ064_04280 [Vibrio parahaemolyticus]|nr:hypothetical protein [Vibrio parahaemolyticus]MBE4310402.1 hypothetical protein [Vibrio parahaemolyticus]
MNSQAYLKALGFKFGNSGAHTSRSMMIEDLKILLFGRPENATLEDYREDIEVFNVLQKPSENARKYSFQPLASMYGLSPDIFLFKVFRDWWEQHEGSQPILALQLAVARDPLLRSSSEVILSLEPGQHLAREMMETFLSKDDPERFSKASLKSFAQNINGTWTQAGYLSGRAKKYRKIPEISYVNVAYALFLAHCHGLSGQRLFDSFWCRMLAQDKERLFELAHRASLRGMINFKQASEVVEVTFPGLVMPEFNESEDE